MASSIEHFNSPRANRRAAPQPSSPPRRRRITMTYLRVLVGALLICAVTAAAGAAAVPQQKRRRAPTATPASSAAEFDRIAAQAAAAREANRLDEALTLYRQALKVRPNWDEGWWYLATLLYDRGAFAEAGQAFAQAVKLQPAAGAAWAMLGLCAYQLGRYDDALRHIQQGLALGAAASRDLYHIVAYHEGILLLLKGEFELARQRFATLSLDGFNNEDLFIAHGLAALRFPMLPRQVGATHRDRNLIRRVGWAEHQVAQRNAGDAQREYERIVADFPRTPEVHYAHGRFLLANRNDDGALREFEREIEISPNHGPAHLMIAFIKLKSKDVDGGLPFAQRAVNLQPRLPGARYVYGRMLLDAEKYALAIDELEGARRMAPDDPKIYFALARAYARVNRQADAARARETFARLTKLAEERAGKETRRTAAGEEDESPEEMKPPAP